MTLPPDEPGPARPPAWSHFLTPLAILLGAAVIVVAIIVTDDDPEPAPPVAPALDSVSASADSLSASAQSLADAAESLSEAADRTAAALQQGAAPGGGAPQGPTLRGTLDGYAESLGLDLASFGQCVQSAAAEEAVFEQLQRGVALGVNGTPTFFINDKYISGAQPAWVFAEVIAAELSGSPTSIEEYSEDLQVLARRDPPGLAIVVQRPDITGVPIEGNPDARVMIVEFSDFQCPFCKRWFDETLPQLRGLIGDDVALAFVHFPLTQIHPNAPAAHVAAECAGEQGKFWEMHDLLFEQQDVWSALPNPN